MSESPSSAKIFYQLRNGLGPDFTAGLSSFLSDDPRNIDVRNQDGVTLLYAAARAGRLEAVEYILAWAKSNNIDANKAANDPAFVDVKSGNFDSTALHGACYGGHYRVVMALMAAGARNLPNKRREGQYDNAKNPADDVKPFNKMVCVHLTEMWGTTREGLKAAKSIAVFERRFLSTIAHQEQQNNVVSVPDDSAEGVWEFLRALVESGLQPLVASYWGRRLAQWPSRTAALCEHVHQFADEKARDLCVNPRALGHAVCLQFVDDIARYRSWQQFLSQVVAEANGTASVNDRDAGIDAVFSEHLLKRVNPIWDALLSKLLDAVVTPLAAATVPHADDRVQLVAILEKCVKVAANLGLWDSFKAKYDAAQTERLGGARPTDLESALNVFMSVHKDAFPPGGVLDNLMVPPNSSTSSDPVAAARKLLITRDTSSSGPRTPATERIEGASDDYSFFVYHKRILGRGAFGTVVEGMRVHRENELDSTPIAVKYFNNNTAHIDQVRSEHYKMQMCKHPNIVKVLGMLDRKNEETGAHDLFLFMEKMQMPLSTLIRKSFIGLHETQCRQLMRDVVRALVHTHHRGFIHADLKSDNIMVNSTTPHTIAHTPAKHVDPTGAEAPSGHAESGQACDNIAGRAPEKKSPDAPDAAPVVEALEVEAPDLALEVEWLVAKIGDFGLSLKPSDSQSPGDGTPIPRKHSTPRCGGGTDIYNPPEAFWGGEMTSSRDIWAWATTYVEALTALRPYEGVGDVMAYVKQQDSAGSFPCPMHGVEARLSHVSQELRVILTKCFEKDPSKRPKAQDLLDMRYFKEDEYYATLVRIGQVETHAAYAVRLNQCVAEDAARAQTVATGMMAHAFEHFEVSLREAMQLSQDAAFREAQLLRLRTLFEQFPIGTNASDPKARAPEENALPPEDGV